MTKIARVTQKVFASNPGFEQILQFGSLYNGTPNYTSDISTIQSLNNWLVGWYNGAVGQANPSIEDTNGLFLVITSQLAYMFQTGIPEWDSGTTYYTGSLVNDGSGNIYVSLINTNLNNALTNTSDWQVVLRSSLPQFSMNIGDANNTPQASNTNLIGDVSASYVSQAYTVTSATPGVFTVSAAPITGSSVYVTVTQNGFTANTRYYVTKVSSTTLKLATTLENALAGINIASTGTTAGMIISGGLSLQNTHAYPGYYGPVTTYVPTIKSGFTDQSADYIILDYDGFDLINMTTGASQKTVTLPAVANNAGRTITIKKIDNGAGTVLISVNGGSIQGASSNTLTAQYSYITLKSDGAIWYVVAVYDTISVAASTSLTGSTTWTGITGVSLPPGTWSTTAFFTMVGSSTNFTPGNGCQASYINPAGAGTLGTTMIQGYPGITGSSTNASVFTGSLTNIETFTSSTQTSSNMWSAYTGSNPTVYAAQRSIRIG